MLKSLFAAIALVAAIAPNSQAVEFVNQDGSKLSQLCIAAAESNNPAINAVNTSTVLCNGVTLKKFVKQYNAAKAQAIALEKANNSPESELCVAAATSNDAFAQAKTNFDQAIISDVACNGVELVKFAKRYNKKFNG